MSCQIKVEQGILQGKECVYNGKKYFSFEGVPYARPPVGPLRFKNPEDPEKWNGVRDATEPGAKCIQMNPNTGALEGSEDCLFLNIYTPSLPPDELKKLPVLFFVHGGKFLFGYGDWYRPDYFIQNDVILVTINYRMHILGFMCLNIPEAPGNAALKDVVKALKWVNKNIINFNGDSNNITVFGESAGASVVTSLLTTKLADDLFAKVIAQSGNCLADVYIAVTDPIDRAKIIASALGKEIYKPKDLYDFFMSVPLEELVGAYYALELSKPPYAITPILTPVVEKEFPGIDRFFDEFPIATIRKNEHKKRPILLGCSNCEGGFFIRQGSKGNIIIENDLKYFIPQYITLNGKKDVADEIEGKIREEYFKGKTVDETMKSEFVNVVSDSIFNRDITFFPEILSKLQNNIYCYQFSYMGNLNIGVMKKLGVKGTTHGDIIQYLFYRKNRDSKCSDADRKIIGFLSEAWCNFAKNGVPTWKNQEVTWEPYSQTTRLILDINEEKKLIYNPKYPKYAFWQEVCGERCKL